MYFPGVVNDEKSQTEKKRPIHPSTVCEGPLVPVCTTEPAAVSMVKEVEEVAEELSMRAVLGPSDSYPS